VTSLRRAALAGVTLGAACAPIGSQERQATVNACPEHPCSAYALQTGAPPVCNGGVCLVTTPIDDLVFVVALAQDSYYAPGRTFAIRQGQLYGAQTADCFAPSCGHLPPFASVKGAYVIEPDLDQKVGWNLGNQGMPTALPVHTTYRPLWEGLDAESVGLPLPLVESTEYVNDMSDFPGPAGGPGLFFRTYVPAGGYERTIAPDPPFDRAFPPDVRAVTVEAPKDYRIEQPTNFDVTQYTGKGPTYPTFDISRAAGLDGWSAYIRDAKTKRRLSGIAALAGATSAGVVLATNHVQAQTTDALAGTEFVLEPPSGQPVPRAVFAPVGNELSAQESYPPLPGPATVMGNVQSTVASVPVEADLLFEAISITDGAGKPNTTNFEFVGRAAARLTASGVATYAVTLPRGQYRVTARPFDDSQAVTIVQSFTVDATGDPLLGRDVGVAPRPSVAGSAVVADGRPLAGAMVDAIPAACFSGASAHCLPRPAQAITTAGGQFTIALDRGGYLLRVRPADGSRLPWVTQSAWVGSTAVDIPTMVIPAPVYAGLRLNDPGDNPIVRAVVRAFLVPSGGPAAEVGRAITDATGQYEMYLASPAQ
jgi:hypothetical protein